MNFLVAFPDTSRKGAQYALEKDEVDGDGQRTQTQLILIMVTLCFLI